MYPVLDNRPSEKRPESLFRSERYWFSFLIILFFGLLYIYPASCSYGHEIQEGTLYIKTYNITGAGGFDVPLSSLLASAGAFVTGFDAIDKNVDGWVSLLLMLEALTGLLFLGLFIVSFSRKVIR